MVHDQQTTKKRVIATASIAAILVSALLCWAAFSPDTFESVKNITVDISHSDGTRYTVEIKTRDRFLSDVLEEESLITAAMSSEYGYVITSVDGEDADFSRGRYWAYVVNGLAPETGADLQLLNDGDVYTFYKYYLN